MKVTTARLVTCTLSMHPFAFLITQPSEAVRSSADTLGNRHPETDTITSPPFNCPGSQIESMQATSSPRCRHLQRVRKKPFQQFMQVHALPCPLFLQLCIVLQLLGLALACQVAPAATVQQSAAARLPPQVLHVLNNQLCELLSLCSAWLRMAPHDAAALACAVCNTQACAVCNTLLHTPLVAAVAHQEVTQASL